MQLVSIFHFICQNWKKKLIWASLFANWAANFWARATFDAESHAPHIYLQTQKQHAVCNFGRGDLCLKYWLERLREIIKSGSRWVRAIRCGAGGGGCGPRGPRVQLVRVGGGKGPRRDIELVAMATQRSERDARGPFASVYPVYRERMAPEARYLICIYTHPAPPASRLVSKCQPPGPPGQRALPALSLSLGTAAHAPNHFF
jgi:hypothetical protein